MHLVVFSYKPCWPSSESPSGFATDGGFPYQMGAISELFASTTLVIPQRSGPPPAGLTPLVGKHLEVEPIPEPPSSGWKRKLSWLFLTPRLLPVLWRQAGRADAVHAVVPGDVGFLGLLVALARRRRIFVRHCGTWAHPQTLADHLLHRLLVRIADERRVVLATGGGAAPPSEENPAIEWIFSTSLSEAEVDSLESLEPASETGKAERPKTPGRRLISVGRLTSGKNVAATIRALPEIRRRHPDVVLDVLGRGPEEERLAALVAELELSDAVVFHGNVRHEEVLSKLGRASALVFPTRVAEGFPKAVLEALACGVPVVVPKVSVLPFLLAEGGGVVVDDVDPATLAAAFRSLLENPETHERHARAGPLIARRYTLEAWRDAIARRLEAAWCESSPEAQRAADEEAPR